MTREEKIALIRQARAAQAAPEPAPQQQAPPVPVQGGMAREEKIALIRQARQQQATPAQPVQAEPEQAPVSANAAPAADPAAMDARRAELVEIGVKPEVIERKIIEEFNLDEAERMEKLKNSSGINRLFTSAGSQVVRGATNVANKVDNFISDRFGDDEKGGGIIDDDKFAEIDRKNELTAENTGHYGTAGRFLGDSIVTAPVDMIGGRLLRPAAKLLRKAPGADAVVEKIAADNAISNSRAARAVVQTKNELAETQAKLRKAVAKKGAVRSQRQADADLLRGSRRKRDDFNTGQKTAAEELSAKADEAKRATAVENRRALSETRQTAAAKPRDITASTDTGEAQSRLAKARQQAIDDKKVAGPKRQQATAARARSDAQVTEWKGNRKYRETSMVQTDALRAEKKRLKEMGKNTDFIDKKIAESQMQNNAMTRYQKGFRDIKIDSQRAAKKAEAAAKKADKNAAISQADKMQAKSQIKGLEKRRARDLESESRRAKVASRGAKDEAAKRTADTTASNDAMVTAGREKLAKAKAKEVANRKASVAAARKKTMGRRTAAENEADRIAARAAKGDKLPKLETEKSVSKKLAQEIEAIGPVPKANRKRRALASTIASNTAQRAVGAGASAAVLADEGNSGEAALKAALIGGAMGLKTDGVKVTAKGLVDLAEKAPYVWSMTQPKISHRYAGRKASNIIGARKKSLARAIENMSDTADPGALKKAINRLKDTGVAEGTNLWVEFEKGYEDDGAD